MVNYKYKESIIGAINFLMNFQYKKYFQQMLYSWFLFFEQFDPNPVTEEGAIINYLFLIIYTVTNYIYQGIARKKNLAAGIKNSNDSDFNVLPSFLPW